MAVFKPDKSEYHNWLRDLKAKVHTARNKAALAVNSCLLELYWDLGGEISIRQEQYNWGSNFIERISIDLKHEFPDIKGFSRRNLYAIRQWYLFYSKEFEFVPQPVAQIPWGHNRLIISRVKDVPEAIFYADESAENGWSRDTLEIQIENNCPIEAAQKTVGHAQIKTTQAYDKRPRHYRDSASFSVRY